MRLLWIVILVISASAQAGRSRQSFKIVTSNFENLFDAIHDKGKKDYTYLPLVVKEAMPEAKAFCETMGGFFRVECFTLDWTNEVVERKVSRISEIMSKVFAPQMPDVVVVQEVENMNALSMVARAMGSRYQAVLIEGPDERGIDTGFITSLPILKTKLHEFPTQSGRPTRGILEMTVRAHRKKVTIFANHWPSQANPDADRMVAGETLLKLAKAAKRSSDLVILAGDFNTARDDQQNALTTFILPDFYDAEAEARALGVPFAALASYSHRGVWHSLDHIFVMKGSRLVQQSDLTDVTIFTDNGALIENYEFRGQQESRPLRYQPTTGLGFSDHLPVALELELK